MPSCVGPWECKRGRVPSRRRFSYLMTSIVWIRLARDANHCIGTHLTYLSLREESKLNHLRTIQRQ
jgi:hypothetical protein